ncbi:MAG: pseudouridine synthase [Limisphaerales bacterium]
MTRPRLDQLLSRTGLASRREAGAWIRAGRVLVAGRVADDPAARVDPLKVRVDGEPLEAPDGLLVLLHKPAGLVCSHAADEGPTIYDALPARWRRRNPPVTSVGRLDRDTTGALLLTDDGALVQRWTHPRQKVEKLYEVEVDQPLGPELVPLFASGELRLPDDPRPCLPAALELTGPCAARLTLVEGRFHQVKRMFEAAGRQVVRLHRARFGEFDPDGLAPGEWRVLPLPTAAS